MGVDFIPLLYLSPVDKIFSFLCPRSTVPFKKRGTPTLKN